jgi:hypothetical protein
MFDSILGMVGRLRGQVGDQKRKIEDTHVFVSHDCGSLTGVRFPRCVEKRKMSAIVDILQFLASWNFAIEVLLA